DTGLASPPPPPPIEYNGQPITFRADFNPCALFIPSLNVDASGHAEVKLHLPDSVTRYRIMAIASSGMDNFGLGESAITARLPLMVKPSPPRFLNFGDKCELPVVLQNQTSDPMNVAVIVRADKLGTADEKANAAANLVLGQRIEVPAHDRIQAI